MNAKEPKEPIINEQLRQIFEGVAEIKNIVRVPLEVPGERRADSTLPDGFELTPDTEATIRMIAAEKLGIGISEDITLDTVGLHKNGVTVIEGGQSHKMLAELTLALETNHIGPIVVSSTEHRMIKLTKDDEKVKERANTAKLLDISEDSVGDTEFAVALQVIERLPGFDVSHNDVAIEDLVKVGTINDRDIYVYSIPRMSYEAENGELKYRQPSISDQTLYIQRIIEAPEAALVTSATYYSSRAVGSKGRFKVAAYCSARLARVRGLDTANAQPDFAQVLAEVAKTDKELAKLYPFS